MLDRHLKIVCRPADYPCGSIAHASMHRTLSVFFDGGHIGDIWNVGDMFAGSLREGLSGLGKGRTSRPIISDAIENATRRAERSLWLSCSFPVVVFVVLTALVHIYNPISIISRKCLISGSTTRVPQVNTEREPAAGRDLVVLPFLLLSIPRPSSMPVRRIDFNDADYSAI